MTGMGSKATREASKQWDGWRAARWIAALLILIPNGLLRLAPLGWDLAALVESYGWTLGFQRVLPLYAEALVQGFGPRLWLSPLLLAASFLFAWIAARAGSILTTRAVLRLGFRVEASGESRLLHPERDP